MRIDNIELQLSGSINTGLRKKISYISNGIQGGVILVADNKIYAVKNNNGLDDFYAAAMNYNFTSDARNGLEGMYNIDIPEETGSLVECKANGPGAYALYDNGNLYTWGYNTQGWCGTGSGADIYYPTLASTGVTAVYTDPSNNMGESYYARLIIKKTDNKIYAAGYNANYELGLGDTTNRTSFTELTWAGTNPISVWNIGSWGGNIIVQKSDGVLAMSGYNTNGQLGNNSTTTPTVAISSSSNAWLNSDTTYRIEGVYPGLRWYNGAWQTGYNSLTILFRNASGTRLVSAGNNNYGQIGDGTTTQRTVPTAPTGTWNTIRQVATKGGGPKSMYVVKDDGTLWTWGYNGYGQLGRGDATDKPTPAQVMSGVINMFAGMPATWLYSHYATAPVIQTADGYWCCGEPTDCKIGDGYNTQRNSFVKMRIPRDIQFKFLGQSSITNQTAGYFFVTTNDEIYCWGYNGGNLMTSNTAGAIACPTLFNPATLQR